MKGHLRYERSSLNISIDYKTKKFEKEERIIFYGQITLQFKTYETTVEPG